MRVAYKVDKVPFYKHVEEFRLDQPVTMSRRDKKSGQQHALLKRLPDSVQVEIKLEGPDKGAAMLPSPSQHCGYALTVDGHGPS